MGFYRDVGLDVDIREINKNINIVDDILKDKTSFVISDSALVYDKLKGKDIKAMMAIYQQSPFILMGLKSSNIQDIKDIHGKRIAMLAGYSANEPHIAKIKNLDIVTFYPKDYGFEGYGDILFTSKEMIENSPKIMYEASYKGWNYAFNHTDEVVNLIYEKELIDLNIYLEEKVKIEIEKNRKQELALMQQSRYVQMGEMISMIAHQWRQPLNNLSIIIQVSILKYQLGKFNDDTIDKLSTDSQKQIMQMSQTIDDFRDFLKPNKHSKEFNVSKLVISIINILKPTLEQELIIINTHLEDDIFIKGFENELGQVLINILNNAKDVLTNININEKKIINIVLKKEAMCVVITIEDNAGGIKITLSRKFLIHIFQQKKIETVQD